MKKLLILISLSLGSSVHAIERWVEPTLMREVDVLSRFQGAKDFHNHVYVWQPNMVPHSVVAYMDYNLNKSIDEALVFPYYSMNRLRSCEAKDRLKVKPNNLVFSICDSLNNPESTHQPYSYITTTKGWVCETCIYEKLFGKLSVIPIVKTVRMKSYGKEKP